MLATDKFSDEEILARTIYGENRGGGIEGMQSVANVIVNRADQPDWWGDDIRSVCLKHEQFDCWDENDPNYEIIMNVDNCDSVYVSALDIASRAIDGTLEDITNSSEYYFAKSMKDWPSWAQGKTPAIEIAGQLFFNNIG